jgi:lipid II:glycine glycyltransferase (peptidoglycan interpeptide bridge formation enzyme)
MSMQSDMDRGLVCNLAERLDADGRAEFDHFVGASPCHTYYQSALWPTWSPTSSLQRFRYLTARHNGALAAAGVVRFTSLAPWRFLASMMRGPVVHDVEMLDLLLPLITKAVTRAGACSLLINPLFAGDDALQVSAILARHGFSPTPPDQQPVHTTTGLIDLEPSEDEIFASFKSRGRRQIRQAQKHGVIVREAVGEADVARLQAVFDAFAAKRADYDVGGLPGMTTQWRMVQELGGVFLLAELQGQVIGGHVVIRHHDTAFWLTLATSDDYPEVPRSYPLLWEAMRRAKAMGCKSYDMAGLPDGEPENAGAKNRQQFKMAFNPRLERLVPVYVKSLRPVSHAILFRARQAYRNSRIKTFVGPVLRRRTV